MDDCFPHVSFLRVPQGHSLSAVRPTLAEHAHSVRQERRAARALFSVQHFNILFVRAFNQAGAALDIAFDCLLTARNDVPVAPNMGSHFDSFTKQISSAKKLRDFVAPVIASSISLDQYPPGMHCKFSPTINWRALPLTV